MIRVLVLDIDGVLTDGKVTLDENGGELKTLSYRDIDAVFAARREGIQVVLVTGEASPIVDVIARRLDARHVYSGSKDKVEALRRVRVELGVNLEEVCFVGDSHRDAEALAMAGLGLAPADASAEARTTAHRVLRHNGGNGAVAEVVEILIELQKSDGSHDIDQKRSYE